MRPGEYGKVSQEKLSTCHPQLVLVCNKIVLAWDNSVTSGYRDEVEQEKAFRDGKSTKHWPNSKHNQLPSPAVDLAPWHAEEVPPIDWGNYERWRAFGGFVVGVAYSMNIKIRWGGDWDGDWNFKDQKLIDMPHFELIL